eukprot:COSAG01_NODE_18944_length_1042_cov_0.629905_2_plen_107_part_00
MALLQTAFDYGRLERPTLQQARRALAQHYQARLEVGDERLQPPYMAEDRAPCTRPAGRQAGRRILQGSHDICDAWRSHADQGVWLRLLAALCVRARVRGCVCHGAC